jgi:glyoxylase-like metal-dependent hydrolase (beta-lactamase superfamily II)
VSATLTPGHTPGHAVYVVKTGARQVWFIGDLVHVAKVQFEHPEVTMAFDTDQAAAAKVRLELWRKAAKEGAVLAGAHLPFPGLGQVKPSGSAFAWVPVSSGPAAK